MKYLAMFLYAALFLIMLNPFMVFIAIGTQMDEFGLWGIICAMSITYNYYTFWHWVRSRENVRKFDEECLEMMRWV